MQPLMTMPTLIISPRGQCVYIEEFGYIEPGEGLGLTVETHSRGQLIRLSSKAWRAYRRRSPAWVVLSLRDSSVHEAGHAIVGMALGRCVQKVSVFPMSDEGGLSLGRTIFEAQRPSEDLILEATKLAMSSFAGGAADRRTGRNDLAGAERDREEVTKSLGSAIPDSAGLIGQLLERSERAADDLADAAWPAIRQLSQVLAERVDVGAIEVADAIEGLSKRRQREVEHLVAGLVAKMEA